MYIDWQRRVYRTCQFVKFILCLALLVGFLRAFHRGAPDLGVGRVLPGKRWPRLEVAACQR